MNCSRLAMGVSPQGLRAGLGLWSAVMSSPLHRWSSCPRSTLIPYEREILLKCRPTGGKPAMARRRGIGIHLGRLVMCRANA